MTDPRPARHARSSAVPVSRLRPRYAPDLDGAADPGEIVWTWVPFEEDPAVGKDRPIVVVARDGDVLYGLMLSSNPRHDGQRGWLRLGAGAWDAEQRVSFVRLDRLLELPENGIRREGAILRPDRFDVLAAALRDA